MITLFFVLIGLVTLLSRFQNNSLVFIIYYGIVTGNSMIPTWLFPGLQRMSYITIINTVSKLIFALGIYIFVNSKKDLLWVLITDKLLV